MVITGGDLNGHVGKVVDGYDDIHGSYRFGARNTQAGIFSSTFLLPVNGSKHSILNCVFNLFFVCFFKNTSYQNL